MGVLNDNILIGASAAGDYEIEQSLKINESRGFLSWTPETAGNRRTWTWSGWVKRATITDGSKTLFAGFNAGTNAGYLDLGFTGADKIGMGIWSTTFRVTNQVFRDTGAWYHIIAAMDTTQSTAANRLKVYVNGDEITSWATNNAPDLNFEGAINDNKSHWLGSLSATQAHTDGYLAEVNFIDGLALTPDSFGETGDYGEWKPLKYTGAYGTNGFYLPFEQDYTVEGFSTVTFEGNGATQYIGGTGFQPDFVWIKGRSFADFHTMYDAVRGATKSLSSNMTTAEVTRANSLTGFSSDGFTVGNDGVSNNNGKTLVAWNWDMGGTTASNTNGSITSSVRANTTYGQSIVSYSGTGSAATFGHGLASAPTMVLVKKRSAVANWAVYHASLGNTNTAFLDLTNAASDNSDWNDTTPTSSVVSIGAVDRVNGGGSSTYIAYCFTDVTGYSKFGSYSGNGNSTGPVVTLGFSPAFVMIKNTASTYRWYMLDNTRDPSNPVYKRLFANNTDAESTNQNTIEFTSTGFNIITSDAEINQSGTTMIYMAFADTREYAYWYDQSGNNNDWTSNDLTESDVMVDSPTNNFCTLNPLDMNTDSYAITVSEGNLQAAGPSEGRSLRSTMGMPSGKWYWEVCTTVSGVYNVAGIAKNSSPLNAVLGNDANGYTMFGQSGDKFNNGSTSSYGSAWNTVGDICGVAFDADNGTLVFYVNNSSQGTAFTGLTSGDFLPALAVRTGTAVMNFGADSSFAGNKTPQGNQDGNDIGDFFYAPPSGFLSLCSANLPSVDVIPSEHFNTVTYTGDGSADQSMTGVGFQPDFLWLKRRSAAERHVLTNILYTYDNGAYKWNDSSATNAEFSGGTGIASFDSNGFSIKTSDTTWNANGSTYVAWNWKAGGSASSNSNGSITSSVSANVDAGFSIVSWTGKTTYPDTMGHGLSQKLEMIIIKNRDRAIKWPVYAEPMGNTKALLLDESSTPSTDIGYWNNTTPTSSVFTTGNGYSYSSGGAVEDYIAYCFHSVDGHSKVGSYTGNGSADGPMVHCGFRPAWVMVKRTDVAENWWILDNKRNPYNAVDTALRSNATSADVVSPTKYEQDFVSNGIKFRTSDLDVNASGGTYIFLAFAESPFKHTNAR
jgi:hypothetical protein